MNPLQYTSKEMYSSTELIRKSKMIFEKLQKKRIDKAIILRDGKPGFMLLDFETYEELMTEYMALKEMLGDKAKVNNTTKNSIQEENIQKVETIKKETSDIDDLSEDDLESALQEIEELDLNSFEDQTEEKPLKEFWE